MFAAMMESYLDAALSDDAVALLAQSVVELVLVESVVDFHVADLVEQVLSSNGT